MAVLISYLRTANGSPYGCIVANGPNLENIGVSICNPKDKFNKHLARVKAEGRIGKDIKCPNRHIMSGHGEGFVTISSVREEIEAGLRRMHERAKKYFKPAEPVRHVKDLLGKMLLGNLKNSATVFVGVVGAYEPDKWPYVVRLNGSIFTSTGKLLHKENYPLTETEALSAEVIEPGPYVDPKVEKWVWALVKFAGDYRVGYLTPNLDDMPEKFPYQFNQIENLDSERRNDVTRFPVKISEIIEVYGPAI